VHFEVKDGSKVLFELDVWCGDHPLKTQFPDIFRMIGFKYASVQEVVSKNGDTRHWNLTFVRSLNDWKKDNICSFLALLIGKEVLSRGNDEIVWRLNFKGSFPVNSFCSTQLGGLEGWDFAASLFGSLRLPQKFVSLLGRPPKARFLHKTCLKEEILAVHVDVICVWRGKNM